MDGQVVRQESELADVLDRFVCLRIIMMQGVSLEQFQFDFDLTFAAVFLEADGTVLGRYGSGAEDSMARNSVAGLRAAMERALTLHENIDAEREALAAKLGPKPAYAMADDFPVPNIERRQGKTDSKSCIHCHMIHEAEVELAAKKGRYDPARFTGRFPPPENIGLDIDPDHGLRIMAVEDGSPAAVAGLQAGDELVRLDGQPLLSIADVQWVLHHASNDAEVAVDVRRGGEPVAALLKLAGAWKDSSIAWRTSMFVMPPAPGLYVEEVKGKKGLALRAKGLFKPAVRDALKHGDLIIEVDGRREPMSAKAFHEYIRRNHHEKGSKMKLVVRRKGKVTPVTVNF